MSRLCNCDDINNLCPVCQEEFDEAWEQDQVKKAIKLLKEKGYKVSKK